jgi:serine/threonine protein phosphatase PrpC
MEGFPMVKRRQVSWATTSKTVQGRRDRQEDRLIITTVAQHALFAAVIDGHKNELAAEALCALLSHEHNLLNCLSGKNLLVKKGLISVLHSKLIEGTRDLDSGAVLSACFLDPETQDVTILHLGDTACILYRGHKPILRTTPHNARCNKADRQMLVDAGCFFDHVSGYIMNPDEYGLQPTRAYGNNYFPKLLKMPEILQHPVLPGDSILLATDGIIATDNLDRYRSDAVHLGMVFSQEDDTTSQIERIIAAGMLNKHSLDNASAILISIT